MATLQELTQRNHQFQEKGRRDYCWKLRKIKIEKFSKTTGMDEPEPLVQSKQVGPEQCK